MLASAIFEFLGKQDQTLVQLGAMAERYFRDDPSTCLLKLRQLQNAFETGDLPARKSGLCKRHCPVTLRILWAVTS